MRRDLLLSLLLLSSALLSFAGGNYRELADSLCSEGVRQYEAGRTREAQVLTSRAIDLLEADGDTLYISRCTAYSNLSRYYARLGDPVKALNAIDKAMSLRKSFGLKRDLNYADLLFSKALLLINDQNYAESIPLLDEVLVLARRFRISGGDALSCSAALTKAETLCASGQYDGALEYISSLEKMTKNLSEDDALSFSLNCLMIAESIFYERGDYEKAQELRDRNDKIARSASERYPLIYASHLIKRGKEAFERNERQSARSQFIEALKHNPSEADEMTCYRFLCLLNFEEGEMEEALKYAGLVMDAVENRPVLDEGKYATVILVYLNICREVGKYAEGISLALEKEPFFIDIYGSESENYASLLSNLSTLYGTSGDMERFFETGEKALAIRKKINNIDKSDIALSQLNLAMGYTMYNDPQRALDYLQKAEMSYNRLPMSSNILRKLSTLYCSRSMAYAAMDDFNMAEKMLDKAREYYNQSGLIDYQSYGTILNNYLVVYLETGNDVKAKLVIDELSDLINNEKLTPQLAIYSSVINSMAQNLSRFYNDERALKLLEQADNALLAVNPSHPFRIAVLNNLGLSWSKTGDLSKAEKYYLQALELGNDLDMTSSPQMVTIRNNIILEICNINPDEGRKLLSDEIALLETNGTASWRSSMLFSQYASFLFFDDEKEKALDYARRAVELLKEKSMTDSFSQREVTANYAFLLLQNGEYDKFLQVAEDLSNKYAFDLRTSFPMLTEEERYNYWNKALGDWYITILPNALTVFSSPRLNELVYDGLLKSRGVLLASTLALADLIAESDDDELKTLYAELRIARAKLQGLPSGIDNRVREELMEDVYKIEQKLNDRSVSVGDFMKEFDVSSLDVRKALRKDEVVIEFVVCPSVDLSNNYGALILSPESSAVKYIPLGNADIFFSFDYTREDDLLKLGEDLFGPLQSELPVKGTIYFTPDGLLHSLPVEAALYSYCDRKGMRTVPDIHRLSSSRLLALKRENRKLDTAAVYGGIDFNASPGKISGKGKSGKINFAENVTRGNLFRDVDGELPILQGTLNEALAAEKLLESVNVDVEVFTGTEGTEGSFKDISGEQCSLIHIGTHGFYWSESEAELMKDVSFLRDSFVKGNATEEDRSLLRSGLLFAGGYPTLCNSVNLADDEEDGVLTAREIAGLNLKKCDLVVLSACKTGLGDITSDGVFGLQRGFKKAGVKSILMSLWPVNDKATGIFMEEFYRNLASGSSPENALQAAKSHLRTYSSDSIPGLKPYSAFNFWAPFVLIDAIKQ